MESMIVDRRVNKWKNLKQRLGLKAMGCCGATWSPSRSARISTISILDDEDEAGQRQHQQAVINRSGMQNQRGNSGSTPLLVGQQMVATSSSGMNLAMALAAERNLRATNNVGPGPTEVKTLMKLIEETEGVDWNKKKRKQNAVVNVDGIASGGVAGASSESWLCCVCMERKKGAAFIPCGHAFCRVCSRELWVDRGSCPVCNRSIVDVLDLF